MFTWQKFYKELFTTLVKNYNSKSLVPLAEEVFSDRDLFRTNPLKDRDKKNGADIPLEEFDPLSFISVLKVKSTAKIRMGRLERVKRILNLKAQVPIDNDGIPTTNAQQKLMFAFKYERAEKDFEKLWDFSRKLVSEEGVKAEDIDSAISVNYCGLAKLSSVMFCVAPEKYMPADRPSRGFLGSKSEDLEKHCSLGSKYRTGTWYVDYLKKIRNVFPERSFQDISHDAWLSKSEPIKEVSSEEACGYWAWQGTPKKFKDFDTTVVEGNEVDWTTNQNFKKIKKGDKGIIFRSGKSAGVVALVSVLDNPYKVDEEGGLYTAQYRCKIRIEKAFLNAPFSKEEMKAYPEFKNFKQGQGSSFKINKKEYLKFEEILPLNSKFDGRYWVLKAGGADDSRFDEWFEKKKIFISYGKFKDCTGMSLKEVDEEYNKQYGDNDQSKSISSRALFQFYNSMKVGDRVILAKGTRELLGMVEVTGSAEHLPEKKKFFHMRPIQFLSEEKFSLDDTGRLAIKTLTRLNPKKEFHQNIIKHYSDNAEFDVSSNNLERENQEKLMANIKKAKNIIYYGPPGTGKTFLFDSLMDEYRSNASSTQLEVEDYTQLSLWEVMVLVLNEASHPIKVREIFQHRFTQSYFTDKNTKSHIPSIWGNLQARSTKDSSNYKNRQDIELFEKHEPSKWALVKSWEDMIDLDEIKAKIISSHSSSNELERFDFVTFHPSYSYEDFVEGIRPDLNEESGGLKYVLESGIFKKLCNRANKNPTNRYALFIDEFNRGNVAKIFGELITLIEPDKRFHKETAPDGLRCRLPLSKIEFGVPPNLDVYASMNTSDRSVTILDMALRRRFQFVAMYPKYNLIEFREGAFVLSRFVEILNERITALLGRDFQIGHSYFMPEKIKTLNDLKDLWFENIIPLIDEYFYGNYDQLKKILGDFIYKAKVSFDIENGQYFYRTADDFEDDSKFVKKLLKLQKLDDQDEEISNEFEESDEEEAA